MLCDVTQPDAENTLLCPCTPGAGVGGEVSTADTAGRWGELAVFLDHWDHRGRAHFAHCRSDFLGSSCLQFGGPLAGLCTTQGEQSPWSHLLSPWLSLGPFPNSRPTQHCCQKTHFGLSRGIATGQLEMCVKQGQSMTRRSCQLRRRQAEAG